MAKKRIDLELCPSCEKVRRHPGTYTCWSCHTTLPTSFNLVRPEHLRPSVFTPWESKVK